MRRVLLFTTMAIAWTIARPSAAAPLGNTSPPPQTSDAAAAQGMFDAAKALMSQGKHAEACPKLEESLRLDPGLGTQYHLGDCYERTGRIASAWATFLQVASQAKATNQLERETVARNRAKALEAQVPRLAILVPHGDEMPGLEVRRDGTLVGDVQWDTPIPLDPGIHRIVANWRGKKWATTAALNPDGETVTVSVPLLKDPPPPSRPPPAEAPAKELEPDDPSRGNVQRAVGIGLIGAGVVGLGVGAYFGLRSMNTRDEAARNCNESGVCNPHGFDLRGDAIRYGNTSTVAFIAGGAVLVGGFVVFLTAPRNRAAETAGARWTKVGLGPGGILATGVF